MNIMNFTKPNSLYNQVRKNMLIIRGCAQWHGQSKSVQMRA